MKGVVYLPEGVMPRDDLKNKKEINPKGTIRYPNKDFYSNFYAICEKAKVSMNEVLVGLTRDFIERNKHLLIKNKK